MYPIGRNKTVFTKEIWDEAYKKLWDAPYRKSVRKFIYFIAVLFIVSFAFVFWGGLSPFYLISEVLFSGVILYYITIQIPHTNKTKLYKKMAMGAGEPWLSYVFCQDHVVVTFPNETTDEINSKEFTDIYHGKKIILIYTTGERNILLDKNGFIGEIPEFLRKKDN